LTISNNAITDDKINTHTSTKISITNKAQLNSVTVYTDQANTYGAFSQRFRSSRLLVMNPAFTQEYIFVASAISANRNITLPLLTGDDVMVTAAFAQTLTNKTLTSPIIDVGSDATGDLYFRNSGAFTRLGIGTTGQNLSVVAGLPSWTTGTTGLSDVLSNNFIFVGNASNSATGVALSGDATIINTGALTISNNAITDSKINTHTSTKISITNKALLNSTIVYTDQANTYGNFSQRFRSSRLLVMNPAITQEYIFVASAITANRNITLPLLTGDDTMVTAAFAQTLTNKTLTSPIIDVGSDATGDLYFRNAGIYTRRAVGSVGQVLTVAGGVPTWATPSGGASYLQFSLTGAANSTIGILSIVGDIANQTNNPSGVPSTSSGNPGYNNGSILPHLVHEDKTITEVRIRIGGAGVGTGTVGTPTVRLRFYRINYSSRTQIGSDVDVVISATGIGIFGNSSGDGSQTAVITGLSIALSAGDLLGCEFVNQPSTNNGINAISRLYVIAKLT